MSLVVVYAPTEFVGQTRKKRNTLIVLGYFNDITSTERAGYELFVGSHGLMVSNRFEMLEAS